MGFPWLTAVSTVTLFNNVFASSEICWDKFDPGVRGQCRKGEWQQRYYYHHESLSCQLFWYDGCQTSSKNFFNDRLSCQWMCEEEPRYKDKSCLEPFEQHYMDECNGGNWKQYYRFEKREKRCVPFWYDGCRGTSQNLYPDLSTCRQTCELPAQEVAGENRRINSDGKPLWKDTKFEQSSQSSYFRQPPGFEKINKPKANAVTSAPHVTHPHRHHLKANTFRPDEKVSTRTQAYKPYVNNVCESSNPCENNGTCVFERARHSFTCECRDGYKGRLCELFDESDPCASAPCRNGATCTAKEKKENAEDVGFDCFCVFGFGGPTCEEKPCDSKPCKNNGTCRTTKGTPPFFCDCQEGWGGSTCAVAIPNTKKPKFGKNVQLISSGRPEWIEDLKKHQKQKLRESSEVGNYTIAADDEPSELNGTNSLFQRSGTTIRQLKGADDSDASFSASAPFLLISFLFVSLRYLIFDQAL